MNSVESLVATGLTRAEAEDAVSGCPTPSWVRAEGPDAVYRWKLCRELACGVAQIHNADRAEVASFTLLATRSLYKDHSTPTQSRRRHSLEKMVRAKRRRERTRARWQKLQDGVLRRGVLTGPGA